MSQPKSSGYPMPNTAGQYPPQQGYPPNYGYPPQGSAGYPTSQPGYPPGYPSGYPPNTTTTVIVQSPQPQPQNYLVLACLVYWLCNCLFGGIAVILSLVSMKSADNGDIEEAKSTGRASFWLSIVGIILTTVIVIIILILYFTGVALYYDSQEESGYSYNNIYNG